MLAAKSGEMDSSFWWEPHVLIFLGIVSWVVPGTGSLEGR